DEPGEVLEQLALAFVERGVRGARRDGLLVADHAEPLEPVAVIEPQAAQDDDAMRPGRWKRRLDAVRSLGPAPPVAIWNCFDVEVQVLGARRAGHAATLGRWCDIERPRTRGLR